MTAPLTPYRAPRAFVARVLSARRVSCRAACCPLLVLGLAVLAAGCGERPPPASPAEAAAPAPAEAPVTAPAVPRLAALQDADAAIAVDGLEVPWGDLRKALRLPVKPQAPMADDTIKEARTLVERFVQKTLLIADARRRGLVVTPEDRQAHIEQLRQALEGTTTNVDDYLKQFPEVPTTPLQSSLDETILVLKLGQALAAEAAVSDAEVDQALQAAASLRAAADRRNAETRQEGERLAALAEARTDDGFAALAREHSVGREGPEGGVLGIVTRAEMVLVNGPLVSALGPGDTSVLLETPTAFRILRILERVPSAGEGDPERFRIAQILLDKVGLPPAPDRAQAVAALRRQKMPDLLRERARTLAKDAKITCPLLPEWAY